MIRGRHNMVGLLLEAVFGTVCVGCGVRGQGVPCRACIQRAGAVRLDTGAVFADCSPVRELVRGAKFGHWRGGARWFAAALLAQLGADRHRIIAVTWVPGDARRVRERGVDLPRDVARRVARELGIPCVQLLVRVRGSRAQRGLHRFERDDNARASFDVHPAAPRAFAGSGMGGEGRWPVRGEVLMVDDVCTTGATLRVCTTLAGMVVRRRFHDVRIRPYALSAVPPPESYGGGVSNSRSLRGNHIHVEA